MKQIVILFFLVFSTISFAQNAGLIVGNILDKELNNAPLAFANVTVKGTDITTTTDFSGLFLIENLEYGDYILVYNFPGYETKEVEVKVNAQIPTDLKLVLGAQTLASNVMASNGDSKIEKATSEIKLQTSEL